MAKFVKRKAVTKKKAKVSKKDGRRVKSMSLKSLNHIVVKDSENPEINMIDLTEFSEKEISFEVVDSGLSYFEPEGIFGTPEDQIYLFEEAKNF